MNSGTLVGTCMGTLLRDAKTLVNTAFLLYVPYVPIKSIRVSIVLVNRGIQGI